MAGLGRSLRVAFAVLLIARLAAGQTTSGTVTGHIVDTQGLPLPGVTVTVEGRNLQRAVIAISSEHGDYVIPHLPPGSYEISFELSGFERQQRMVNVAPTQRLPINITMGPAVVAETIDVVGRTADVLTQTALVATNFKQDFVSTLPTTRDINAIVLRAPAVHPSGPSGAYSFAGSMSFESLYMVNGVTVNENVRGQANTLYIEDAIQETTVATDGVSAEYGRFSGGIVNVITKSGGNLFSGSFRDTLNNDSWRALTPFPGDSTTDKLVPQYEYVFGGPALKDQLWFFTAGRFQNQTATRQTVAPLSIPYVFEDNTKRYEAKATYSVNSSHRFQGNFIKVTELQVNDAFGSVMDLASLRTRELPQDLFTIGYNGILSPRLFVEGRYSSRRNSFIGSGAPTTDPIYGTLLQDRARGNLRYWSPTFCGVCGPEKRDNDDTFVKATYFKSTKDSGSHNMVFGYETFDDKRFNNSHQSGSDYRIVGTTTIIRNNVIYPQWLPGVSTQLFYTPITQGSLGAHFQTHSLFFNDNWQWNNRVTLALGVRWDKNEGRDSADQLVADDSAISPRVGVVWDPKGDGRWAVTGSFAKYVAAINSTLADATAAAGNPAAFVWVYNGPSINSDATAATLTTSDVAIQQVFNWFKANGGTSMTPAASALPGVSTRIVDALDSPNVLAYAAGVSRQIGNRGVVRADFSYRDYRDFYSLRIDTSTGTVVDPLGNKLDLAIVENTNDLKRRYSGVTLSANYHLGRRTDLGGNYTLSHLWGNFDGENTNSGPMFADAFQYPEYRQLSWYAPEGDLAADQRHRSSMWINYGVPGLEDLTVSLLQDLTSGVPYGGVGTVDARSFVTPNPGYVTPQGAATELYYYTPRDAFRTESSRRTDFSASYVHGIGMATRKLELFVQAQVLNLFNKSDLCGCGADVFGNGGSVYLSRIGQSILSAGTGSFAKFNPLTTAPVQGTNWNYGSNFGTALSRLAYTSPRTFRMTFGVRF
jgi:Carboxypeptidase regulatory-like domain/TonB dependent receptor